MSIKYEIEKEKLEEIRQERSKTNNKKEVQKIICNRIKNIRIYKRRNSRKNRCKFKNNSKMDKIIYRKWSTRNTKQKKTR